MVVGDNGVLTQAQQAKIRTEEEDAKEEIEMEVVGCYDDSGKINLGKLNENLRKKGGVSLKKSEDEEEVFVELDEEENQIEGLPVTVKYKNAEIEITGEYTGGPDKSKSITSLTESDYGKYINYPIDTDGDNNPNNNWRIFYKDDEHIFIKAADYLTEQKCNVLKTAADKAGMKQYNTEKYAYEYRWVNSSDAVYHCNDGRADAKFNVTKIKDESNPEKEVDKPQCSFPEIFMPSGDFCKKDGYDKEHYYCSDHVGNNGKEGNTNSRCASALQCTGNWSSFVDTNYADKAIGGPTLEMWVASWNQKYGNEKKLYIDGGNDEDSVSGYKIGTSVNSMSTSISLSSFTNGYNDTLYFPHKTVNNDLDNDSTDEECYGYWLASPSASGSDDVMRVDCDGYVGSNFYNYYGVGLCPVVSLKSDVKIEWKTDGDTGYYEIVKNN